MSSDNFLTFSKPFVDALKSVFDLMVETTLTIGKPEIKTDTKSKGDVTSIMGMSGVVECSKGKKNDFQGMICLSFPQSTYLKVSSAMLGQEYTDIDDEIKDVGNEITNMIMGNAKGELNPQGYKIEMSIPSVIIGSNHELSYPKQTITIVIPISCLHGEFFMEICYQDIKK